MNARRNDGGLLERPLTARSVVLSLLLGRRPPRARVALLVRWSALFGISQNAARVALSRMVERGELVVEQGSYALAGRLLGRQAQQEAALAPVVQPWDGAWHVVVTGRVARSAQERQRARDALRNLHFAEWREGVWARPDNVAPPSAMSIGDDAMVWTARPLDGDPRRLAEELFALEAWALRGRELLRELRRVNAGLDPARLVSARLDPHGLAPAFVAGAASLQHLRRDPLVPQELLPRRWPGDDLRAAYEEYRSAFSSAVSAWWRSAS